MKLGIVSDTHGHLHNTLNAVRMLESFTVDLVIHCGDIGSAEIPPLFAAWPAHYVLGNVDREETELREAIESSGGTCHGRFGSLQLAEQKVAFMHGDDAKRLQASMASGEWDVVCYGHTHRAEQHWVNETLVLNPGAIYRARPHTVTVLELPARELTLLEL